MNPNHPLVESFWSIVILICLLIAGDVASGGDRIEGFGE